MADLTGQILPSDSTLSQFELAQFVHGGSCNDNLPIVIWADRYPTGEPCPAGNPCFGVQIETDEYKATPRNPWMRPVVCLCMGRFLE